MFGGSSMMGPQYFMDQDVVLVTMNYRLGALGKYRIYITTINSII